jgi:hypothetical protein
MTRQGERIVAGAGEMVLDRSLASGLRDLIKNGGGHGQQVVIQSPHFHVNIQGVDSRSIDARGLVHALLPQLREALRLGDLRIPQSSLLP